MAKTYTTLLGEEVEISELSQEQKELLGKALESFKNQEDYFQFFNFINSNDSLRILGSALHNGQYWIDEKVINSALSKVLQDLADRLAIEQGLVREGDKAKQFWDFTENEKTLNEVLS